MHVIIERDKLKALLQKVSPAVVKDGHLPVFSCISLVAFNNTLVTAAGDDKVVLKSSEVCETRAAGSAGVNGKALQDIVANFLAGPITLKTTDTRLSLANAKATVHLTLIPLDSFMPTPDYLKQEYSGVEEFFALVDRVRFATSDEDPTRVFTSGVHIDKNCFVATDGRRLSMVAHKYPIQNPITVGANMLSRIHKPLGDQVGMSADGNRLHFKSGSTYASVNLLECKYPAYQALIPNTAYKEAKIKFADFRSALKLAQSAADQKELDVTLDFDSGKLTIYTQSEGAEAKQVIDASFDGKVAVAINVTYLLEVMDHLKNQEEVVIEIRDGTKPLIIKEDGYVNIIMPKRPRQISK